MINVCVLTFCLAETSARQDKPVSIPFASGASSHVGDQAVLECVADGHPSPSVRWQRRGDQGVLLPERAVQHLGSLKIPDVSVDDAGVYECVVENRLGTPVMQEVVLEVIGEFVNSASNSILIG